MIKAPEAQQLEARARWHLELGYMAEDFEPLGDYPDDDDGAYLGDFREPATCWACGGEGNEIDCCDDLCHGQGWCMHGDNRTCRECGGEGVL